MEEIILFFSKIYESLFCLSGNDGMRVVTLGFYQLDGQDEVYQLIVINKRFFRFVIIGMITKKLDLFNNRSRFNV